MEKKAQNRLLVFFRDPNKKGYFKIFSEILYLTMSRGIIPKYYLKHFYKKDFTNYKDYLGTQYGILIHESPQLHKSELTSIISNKLVFAIFCEKYKIRSPKLVLYNVGNVFYHDSEKYSILTADSLANYIKNILSKENLNQMFLRPFSALGGKDCFTISKNTIEEDANRHFTSIVSGSFTFTEVIEQHDEINRINKKSVNTIRIVTYIDNKNQTHIIASLMRFGVGDSVVDNAASGGFFVGINHDTGTLKEKGYQSMKFGGKAVTEHPDSKFRFGGFKIPYYKEACNLVINATEYIPDRFTGWDIAITPTGPTLIEGNENPDLHMTDVSYNGLLKNQHVKSLIKKLKANKF